MEKALSELRNIKDSINSKMNTVLWVVSVLSAIGLILKFI